MNTGVSIFVPLHSDSVTPTPHNARQSINEQPHSARLHAMENLITISSQFLLPRRPAQNAFPNVSTSTIDFDSRRLESQHSPCLGPLPISRHLKTSSKTTHTTSLSSLQILKDICGCQSHPYVIEGANALTFGAMLACGLAARHKSLKLSLQMLSMRMIWLERLAKVAIGYMLHSVRAFCSQKTCRCGSCTYIE